MRFLFKKMLYCPETKQIHNNPIVEYIQLTKK